jgi:hypothetical protein
VNLVWQVDAATARVVARNGVRGGPNVFDPDNDAHLPPEAGGLRRSESYTGQSHQGKLMRKSSTSSSVGAPPPQPPAGRGMPNTLTLDNWFSGEPGTGFTNCTQFLIRNPSNFLLAPLSGIIILDCLVTLHNIPDMGPSTRIRICVRVAVRLCARFVRKQNREPFFFLLAIAMVCVYTFQQKKIKN